MVVAGILRVNDSIGWLKKWPCIPLVGAPRGCREVTMDEIMQYGLTASAFESYFWCKRAFFFQRGLG